MEKPLDSVAKLFTTEVNQQLALSLKEKEVENHQWWERQIEAEKHVVRKVIAKLEAVDKEHEKVVFTTKSQEAGQ